LKYAVLHFETGIRNIEQPIFRAAGHVAPLILSETYGTRRRHKGLSTWYDGYMARQTLKDSTGRTIGHIEDKPNEQQASDATGRRVGRYDKKTNKTYDASGRMVGNRQFTE
jgi:hypothetical protein